MDSDLINRLVDRASQYGARGYHVVGWIPPATATANPEGMLIAQVEPPPAGSGKFWYE